MQHHGMDSRRIQYQHKHSNTFDTEQTYIGVLKVSHSKQRDNTLLFSGTRQETFVKLDECNTGKEFSSALGNLSVKIKPESKHSQSPHRFLPRFLRVVPFLHLLFVSISVFAMYAEGSIVAS